MTSIEQVLFQLEEADQETAVAAVRQWLSRMPAESDRMTAIEEIIRCQDKATRQYIGEVFFDIDAEVGADEESD